MAEGFFIMLPFCGTCVKGLTFFKRSTRHSPWVTASYGFDCIYIDLDSGGPNN